MTDTQTALDFEREELTRMQQHWSNLLKTDEAAADEYQLLLERQRTKVEEWEADLERTPIDAHVVALDETSNYEIADADKPFIAEIRGVYVFDRNEHTHCCELTPSYYLIHLYDQVRLTDAGEALSQDRRDELYQEYEHCNGGDDPNKYIHCSSIERFIATASKANYNHYGATEVSYAEVPHDEQMDAMYEGLNANCVI